MMLTEITYKHNELHQLCQNIYKVIFHFVPVMGILCARVPVFKNYFHFFPPFLSECASLSLYVCVCGGGDMCRFTQRPRQVTKCPGVGVTGSCELPHMGVGNKNQVL